MYDFPWLRRARTSEVHDPPRNWLLSIGGACTSKAGDIRLRRVSRVSTMKANRALEAGHVGRIDQGAAPLRGAIGASGIRGRGGGQALEGGSPAQGAGGAAGRPPRGR